MKRWIHKFDAIVSERMAKIPRSYTRLFLAVTMCGDPVVTLLIGAVMITKGWTTGTFSAVYAGLAIPLTLTVGYGLKLFFERARPPITSTTYRLKLDTFSFPSGHASGSMVTYGLLAYGAYLLLAMPWSFLVGGVMACLPLLVGLSRVYLGVHYASDVVAGWLLGAATLTVVFFLI